jgi:hypothetical protein
MLKQSQDFDRLVELLTTIEKMYEILSINRISGTVANITILQSSSRSIED